MQLEITNMDIDTINTINKEERNENREYRYKMNLIEKSLMAIDPRFKIVREKDDLSYYQVQYSNYATNI